MVVLILASLNIIVVNIAVLKGLNISPHKIAHHLLLVEVTLYFRETDLPNADPVTSDEQGEVTEQQIRSSSTVFILPRESMQTRILSRLDKKIPLKN